MTKGELIRDCILYLGEDDEDIDPTIVSSLVEYKDRTRKIVPIVNRCGEIVSDRLKLPIKCVEFTMPNKDTYDGIVKVENTNIWTTSTKYIKNGVVECIVYRNKVLFRKPKDFKQFTKCVLVGVNGLNKNQNGGVLGDYIEFDRFDGYSMLVYYHPKFIEYLEQYNEFYGLDLESNLEVAKTDPRSDYFEFVETPRNILNLIPMYVYSEIKKEEQPSLAVNESNKFFAFLDEINNGDNVYHQSKLSFDFQEEFD